VAENRIKAKHIEVMKVRLNKVLLSSYALGESHPDSCWMAFEVSALVVCGLSFTPTPTLPLEGEGVVGVLDGF
jgi:hypothetical protein